MFCPNCGATVNGKFCEKCGAAVQAGPGVGSTASGSTATGSNAPPVASAPGLQMNVVSALCYVFPIICSIIFLLVDPYKRDARVRFAAFQSLFLALAFVALSIVLGIVLAATPDLAGILFSLLRLLELLLFLFLAFKAFQNEKVVLPGVGPLAAKQV